MTHLPPEARDGLMRAWLSILAERHPGVTWVAAAGPPGAQRPQAGAKVIEVDFGQKRHVQRRAA